jgi:cell division septation protein DedD
MSKNRSPKNSKIIPLFITFAILFIVVFALGVIIGKGLGGSDSGTRESTYNAEAPEIEYGVPEIVEEDKEETESEEVIIIDEADSDMYDDEAVSESSDESRSKETESTEVTAPAKTPEKEITSAVSEPDKKEESEEKETAKTVVGKTPTPTKKSTQSAAMPRIDPNGRYTVQIGAFQNQTEANKLVNSLKSSGYPAFIKQLQTPDKKNWYRVRVGTFSTRPDAVVYGEKLKQSETKVKSVFITVNN